MFNILSGVSDLENISLGVAISVIALLTITYILLFFIWHRYYEKCIRNGLEDTSLKRDIMVEYKKYLKPIPLKQITNETKLEQADGKNLDFDTVTQEVEFKKKKQDLSINVVLGILYIILIMIFAGGIQTRVSEGTTNYFGNSYLVIKTGSMETVDGSNTYIYDFNLNNQITQYSLIQMDEVKEEDMKLYDIYAFYGKDNEIIVHRLIAINQGENGLTYTFRGDANPASAPYERNVTFDRIIARYNGTSNYVLGVVTLYLSSNIGLITVFFAFSSALFFDLFEAKANKAATRRKMILLKEIFKAIKRDYRNKDLLFNVEMEYKEYGKGYYKDNMFMSLDRNSKANVYEDSLTKILEKQAYEYKSNRINYFKVRKTLKVIDRKIVFDIDLIDKRTHQQVTKRLEDINSRRKSQYVYKTSLSGFDKSFVIILEVVNKKTKTKTTKEIREKL